MSTPKSRPPASHPLTGAAAGASTVAATLPPAPPLPQERPTIPRPSAAPELVPRIESERSGMLATGGAAVYHKLRSSMHPDAFQHYDGNVFPLAPVNEPDARGAIEMKPPHIDGLAILPADELEALANEMLRQTSQLGELEAHTLDALSHLWIRHAQHPQARVVVSVDELLELRGLERKKSGSGRRGGFRPEQRQEMLQTLARIQNLWLRIDELSTYADNGGTSKKSRRETRRGVTGPAFIITGAGGQVRLNGSLDVDRVSFTPGDVLSLYLWGPGRQTALIDAKVLHLDPYRQVPESALARYLSWLWKVRATKGTYRDPLRVDTLLENARIPINTTAPSVTLQRLEKTLDTLRREGIIGSWKYKHWNAGDAPARGWLAGWRQALITIEPPASIMGHYTGNLRGALPAREATPLPDRLRATRERLRLTQAQASEACAMSQQAYSRAERGKGVAAQNRAKLEAWLARHVVSSA